MSQLGLLPSTPFGDTLAILSNAGPEGWRRMWRRIDRAQPFRRDALRCLHTQHRPASQGAALLPHRLGTDPLLS